VAITVTDPTRDSYRRALVTIITNRVNGTPVTPLSYSHDALERITSRNSDTFGYNSRSEVISADIQSTASRYAFDGIGNNLWTSFNSATNTYTANALNQYTAIDAMPLAYDNDGNLLTNGVWSYTWDCENRLTAVYSNAQCVVSNAYDHAHRRVLKVTPTTTCTYLYDGWTLVQETVQTQRSTVTNRFVWGRDLSGTLQGAGGIGGLLAVQMDGAWYFPLFDHNGNVTAYVDEQSSIAAQYTYGAFGSELAATGSMAGAFRHRFSTKYLDVESGLYYYGYRFYSPELMRWLSRDPLGEWGSDNAYGCVDNRPIMLVDYLGLFDIYGYPPDENSSGGHIGIVIDDGTRYDYGRYHGKYRKARGPLGKGPNVLVKDSGVPSSGSHAVEVYHFDVCPELDRRIREKFNGKFTAGASAFPKSVADRLEDPKRIPLAPNERYLGTDWSLGDNCSTFTLRNLRDVCNEVLAEKATPANERLRREARDIERMITGDLLFMNVDPGTILFDLKTKYTKWYDWIRDTSGDKGESESDDKKCCGSSS
jgi:RHS repeat-associated protein